MSCRKDVTHHGWIDDMVREFRAEYQRHAEYAMESFLDCIFKILWSSKGRTKPYQEQISKLGTQLKSSSVIDDKKYPHHRCIMRLLEIGLLSRHSHMFILPQINKETLLNDIYYCSLILAVKLYALGEYDEAVNYAKKIGKNCSLALYICGQSYRKIGDYAKAHAHLQQGIMLLGQGKCGCPFTGKEEGICNEDLLKAVLFRARAVVFRKQKEFAKAEKYYEKAEQVVNSAMRRVRNNIPVSNMTAHQAVTEVAADVYFSFGYYYYNQRNYDRAEKLFKKSIDALEASQVDWDSPYTRLAIVNFCQGKYREANELFANAAMICEETISTNREASLSLALCRLGCKITSDLIGQVSTDNPIDKLEDAINQAPRLTLGPLECHLDDAKHFLEKANDLSSSSRKLVKEFINRIRQEISMIKIEHIPPDSEHWELVVKKEDEGFKYELRIGNSVKHYMHKVKISDMYIDKLLDDFGSGKIKYDDLITLGRDHVKKLFPEDLRKLFSQSTKGKTLVLWLDKETFKIPWELMLLENNEGQEEFLCERFQVGRWIYGKQNPTREIRISPLALVAYNGGGKLKGVNREVSVIQNLNLSTRIYSTRQEVLDLFENWNKEDYYGLHFSGESQYDKNEPLGFSFELEDGPLRREDLNILIDNLPCGLGGPSFIFLNFCDSVRQSLSLTGFEGWVEYFFKIEPSALIATMWKAEDSSAAEFASKFYGALLKKKNSGLAMQEARKSIKDNNDLTWLCYVLYGDPRAQLR